MCSSDFSAKFLSAYANKLPRTKGHTYEANCMHGSLHELETIETIRPAVKGFSPLIGHDSRLYAQEIDL